MSARSSGPAIWPWPAGGTWPVCARPGSASPSSIRRPGSARSSSSSSNPRRPSTPCARAGRPSPSSPAPRRFGRSRGARPRPSRRAWPARPCPSGRSGSGPGRPPSRAGPRPGTAVLDPIVDAIVSLVSHVQPELDRPGPPGFPDPPHEHHRMRRRRRVSLRRVHGPGARERPLRDVRRPARFPERHRREDRGDLPRRHPDHLRPLRLDLRRLSDPGPGGRRQRQRHRGRRRGGQDPRVRPPRLHRAVRRLLRRGARPLRQPGPRGRGGHGRRTDRRRHQHGHDRLLPRSCPGSVDVYVNDYSSWLGDRMVEAAASYGGPDGQQDRRRLDGLFRPRPLLGRRGRGAPGHRRRISAPTITRPTIPWTSST